MDTTVAALAHLELEGSWRAWAYVGWRYPRLLQLRASPEIAHLVSLAQVGDTTRVVDLSRTPGHVRELRYWGPVASFAARDSSEVTMDIGITCGAPHKALRTATYGASKLTARTIHIDYITVDASGTSTILLNGVEVWGSMQIAARDSARVSADGETAGLSVHADGAAAVDLSRLRVPGVRVTMEGSATVTVATSEFTGSNRGDGTFSYCASKQRLWNDPDVHALKAQYTGPCRGL